MDSQVIHLSNNRGQDDKHPLMKDVNTAQQRFFSLLIDLTHIHLAWCDFCRYFQIVLKKILIYSNGDLRHKNHPFEPVAMSFTLLRS